MLPGHHSAHIPNLGSYHPSNYRCQIHCLWKAWRHYPGINERERHVDISTALTPHLLGFRISVSAVLNLREVSLLTFFQPCKPFWEIMWLPAPPFSSLLDSWTWLRNWGRRAFPISQKGIGPVFALSACQMSYPWQDFLGFPEVLQHLIQ